MSCSAFVSRKIFVYRRAAGITAISDAHRSALAMPRWHRSGIASSYLFHTVMSASLIATHQKVGMSRELISYRQRRAILYQTMARFARRGALISGWHHGRPSSLRNNASILEVPGRERGAQIRIEAMPNVPMRRLHAAGRVRRWASLTIFGALMSKLLP